MRRLAINIDQCEFTLQIEAHESYCKEFKKRIFPQFDDDTIIKEADEKEQCKADELANSISFDPEKDDPHDSLERIERQAFEAGVEHYLMLNDMKRNVYLVGLTGMYHQWEKGLKERISNFLHGDVDDNDLRNFKNICNFLTDAGWDIRQELFYANLNLCRLVVNTYKHGEGTDFDKLKNNHSEYFKSHLFETFPEDLQISEIQFEEFSDAILQFWKSFPEQLNFSIPTP